MFVRRVFLLGVVAVLSVLVFGFCVGLYLFGEKVFGVRWQGEQIEDLEKAISSARAVCKEEFGNINDAQEAAARGDEYFNGERGYDIACARAGYERALAIDQRGSLFAWHQLGRIDFIGGNFDDAIYKFEKQQEYFDDKLPNVHYMLGLTYGYKARKTSNGADWKKAEEEFLKYITLDPLSPWARTDLAWVYFAQGKYEEMKKPLEEALLKQPTHAWLLNMYGLALMNTDDREGARMYFAAAVKSAQKLTIEDWGRAYPGNDPAAWPEGLASMERLIEKNLRLVSAE